ncbi:MAG: hypothetical protein DRJ06_03265 [Candidatus Aminicenantes bacterium]|nr:MAG: hypothetical protein DRJ06_03265 [Candidatus Aminicenantes bacterium]
MLDLPNFCHLTFLRIFMSFSRIITNDIFPFNVLDFPSLAFLHSRKKLMLKRKGEENISSPKVSSQ